MVSDFTLDNYCEIIMGQSPTGETCNKIGIGTPLLNGPSEFGETHPIPVQFTSDVKKKSNLGDLLFCVRGSTGRMNWADQEYAIGRGLAAIRAINNYPIVFVRAIIETKLSELLLKATGSVFSNVNKEMIASISVRNITVNEAKSIASILKSIEDQILLLRQTNSTLEAIAQTLFKSWFVDFDPVREKQEGKKPKGIDEATATLFPDSFEQRELSEIPKGWINTTIESLCDVVTRGVSPVYKTGSNLFIVNQKVNRGKELDFSALKELSPTMHISKEKMLQKWDLLVNCLGEGTLGRVHLYKLDSFKYAFDQHMSICRSKPSVSVFLYQILSSTSGQEKIQALKTGSTGMTMFNISKLREYPIIWPGQLIIDQYFDNIKNLFEKIAINDNQIRTLSSLRDSLLPRLISGQLRLPQLDEINNKTMENH